MKDYGHLFGSVNLDVVFFATVTSVERFLYGAAQDSGGVNSR